MSAARLPSDDVAVYLAFHYPTEPMDALVAHLGVPAWRVQRWAQALQIRRHRNTIPPYMELVSHAAKRVSLEPKTLRRIVYAIGGKTYPTRRSRERMVRSCVVDRGVAWWTASETINAGAWARDVDPRVLRRWLREAGELPRKKCGRRATRVLSEVLDRIVRANSLDNR